MRHTVYPTVVCSLEHSKIGTPLRSGQAMSEWHDSAGTVLPNFLEEGTCAASCCWLPRLAHLACRAIQLALLYFRCQRKFPGRHR